MKQLLLKRVIPHVHGRIIGWVVFGILFAGFGAAASETYVMAVRQQEAAESAYYNDQANLDPALKKYREVVKKFKDYTAQGVSTTGLDASLIEIKEDLLDGVYTSAITRIDELNSALDQLYAAKVEADKLAQTPPAPPSPPRAPR